jgi:deazaflavin-dependent oxidoreductase (nitroreductase family)
MTDMARAAQERRSRDESMVAEVRANAGRRDDSMAIVILHTIGEVSGRVHLKPVCVSEDGTDLIVAATAGGQPRHPQWYANLEAQPDITVEYMGETLPVRAELVPNSPARDRLFERMQKEIPGIYGYQDRCRETRQIPIVRLVRS